MGSPSSTKSNYVEQLMANTMHDDKLVQLLQAEKSRNQAFRALTEKYQERLYWHIRRMVGGHEDANDVVQNTFIKVFRSIKNFKGQSALYTWLYRIATNESITFIKKRSRKQATSLNDEETGLANQLKADSYFDGDEVQLKLKIAISKLPEKQRVVFNLRYYDEMTYKEISEVLGTSIGGLKASYHHAAKKIEQFFKEN